MIKLNNKIVDIGHFPDGTLLIKEDVSNIESACITWKFENNEEMVVLMFLTQHLRTHGIDNIILNMPYIPNARQDRVKKSEDVFTLKYFAKIINTLGFSKVCVLDPHSSVSEALIDRIQIQTPKRYVEKVIDDIGTDVVMFYPDEGAMKRYSSMIDRPYAFGIKKRDWSTGSILGLDVSGQIDRIENNKVLIVDDICSRGGTFYHSAKKLKELGAAKIYLYISHCENTILEGEVLKGDLIERVYTTDSIFTKNNEKIKVIDLEL